MIDVNECQAGLGLCGEEAECFNGVGTYLCRCKKGYEDHSPTKSGTLCIRAPRAGRGWNCGSAPSPGCCCPGLSGERSERAHQGKGLSPSRGGPAPLLVCAGSGGFRCPCQVWNAFARAGNRTSSPRALGSLPPACCFLCIRAATWHM